MGAGILIGAIIYNAVMHYLGIATWYTLINSMLEDGVWQVLSEQGVVALLLQFIVYPFWLGGTGYIIMRLLA